MFHIGWFLGSGFGIQSWGAPGAVASDHQWMRPDPYIRMAKLLEEACFDYMMFEDSLMVTDTYQNSMEYPLKHGASSPKNDPLPLLPILARETSHIGLIGTIATTFSHPFSAARLGATLDHLTNGRFGFNLVTASSHRSAQNYGLDKHVEHDKRYTMASEWMDLVGRLWDSWEPGALVADEETGVYVDHTKVHLVNFEGEFYKCRGPLNTLPGPQHRPVICQAGGSGAGRAFGATHADTVIGSSNGMEPMRSYRRDMDRLLAERGRKPNDCKVLFLISPVLGDTEEEAQDKQRAITTQTEASLERSLFAMSYFSGMDLSKFDVDEPLPPDFAARINGHQSTMADYMSAGPTLRQMAKHRATTSVELVGTPDKVAAQMDEITQEIKGDGFLVASPVTLQSITEIARGLAPALKRRGAIRTGYEHATLRENLLAF
jgi:FMN-dependent oxidoreductase (nitrilotriacetate monooxygenase family)